MTSLSRQGNNLIDLRQSVLLPGENSRMYAVMNNIPLESNAYSFHYAYITTISHRRFERARNFLQLDIKPFFEYVTFKDLRRSTLTRLPCFNMSFTQIFRKNSNCFRSEIILRKIIGPMLEKLFFLIIQLIRKIVNRFR
jgi:hypothetical protein